MKTIPLIALVLAGCSQPVKKEYVVVAQQRNTNDIMWTWNVGFSVVGHASGTEQLSDIRKLVEKTTGSTNPVVILNVLEFPLEP